MTEADISSTIATLFAASKAACSLFYLPQIYAVWRTTTGARDMALPTWSFFALSNALGVDYLATLHDMIQGALLAETFCDVPRRRLGSV